MRKSVIKTKLAKNEPVLLTQFHLTDPSIFELAGLMGFDGIWMDMEHHGYSLQSAANMIRATRIGKTDVLARPGKGEFPRLSRMLEAGAHGIMYPRCDDAAEAAEAVKWTKFAPLGKRGFDGGNPDMPYCTMSPAEYVKVANDETFLLIQLEEQKAVDNAEAIAAVPGVDVLFFGPADFTVLSGFPGQFDHPKVLKAMEHIAKVARSAGKHWGTPAMSLEHAKRLLDMGARLICHSADIVMIKQGLERMQEQFAPLGFRFDNSVTATKSATVS